MSVALVALLGLVHAGCIGTRMIRGADSVVEGEGYSIAFIEFDDFGELWMPAQVNRALATLESANEHPDGAIFLLFVHGWNHNASEDDSNVLGFHQQLRRLAEAESRRADGAPRPVVGVFIGWRGKLSPAMPINLFSFYGRRGAAERVASLAATETIYRLITHAKNNDRTRTVLIGHSFGGAILETALSQALVGFLLQNKGEDVDFPADLVFLVNPASQALRAKQFVEILARHRLRLYRTGDDGQVRYERPLIVSMTSSGDWATGVAFPLGLGIKGLTKNYRSYGSDDCNAVTSQRLNFRKTAGHTRELLSHQIHVEPLAKPFAGFRSAEALAADIESRYDPLSRLQRFVIEGSRLRFSIQRRAGAFNDTPYWIMRVPTSVLPDHGQIFGADFQDLISAMIAVTGSLEADVRTVMVREESVRPLGLAHRIDGKPGILFLDRSRRIYSVAPDEAPVFFACLPSEAAAVENSLGFAQEGHDLRLGRVGHELDPDSARNRVEVLRMRLVDDDTIVESRVRFDAGFGPSALAFDVVADRVFLARHDAPTLSVADLGAKRIEVEPLVNLGALGSVSLLVYEPQGRQIFASNGIDTVVRLPLDAEALGTETLRTEVVAHDLDTPTALAFDRGRRLLYVATRDHKIWVHDCPDRCGPGRVFAPIATLTNPTALLVTDDSVVWVGDPDAQSIQCYSSDGDALGNHDHLPRE